MTDLNLETLSIEELKREIEKRQKPKPLFEKDGKLYYDVVGYNKLLDYYGENGVPTDFTPIEFNPNGTPKAIEPRHVVINLEAYVSNRVRIVKGAYHMVIDTRTIRESESGNITTAFIPEYILKKDGDDWKVQQSTVSREEFLKNYTDSFGVTDMLKILSIIDRHNNSLESGTSTLTLGE